LTLINVSYTLRVKSIPRFLFILMYIIVYCLSNFHSKQNYEYNSLKYAPVNRCILLVNKYNVDISLCVTINVFNTYLHFLFSETVN